MEQQEPLDVALERRDQGEAAYVQREEKKGATGAPWRAQGEGGLQGGTSSSLVLYGLGPTFTRSTPEEALTFPLPFLVLSPRQGLWPLPFIRN